MRSGTIFGWCVVAGLALFGGGWLALNGLRMAQTREEMAAFRDGERDLARLRAENQRLAAESISPAALAALRADHVAVIRLRAELEALKARPTAPAPPPPKPTPPQIFSPSESRNVGRGTATASLETLVWAAANADVETLGQTLALDGVARKKADELFARLPLEDRNELKSADRLIAFLTAKDVIARKMSFVSQMAQGDDRVVLKVLVDGDDGAKRLPALSLRRQADGWKLLVPESAIDKYVAQFEEHLRTSGAR